MTAHDELLRQLRASVRTIRVENTPDTGAQATGTPLFGRPRRPRRRRARRGLLVALAALVVGGGVAGAAQVGVLPGVHGASDHPLSAREVAHDAMMEVRDSPACRTIARDRGATTQATEVSAAATALLAGPPDASAQAQALRLNHGGPVIAGSPRRVAFPDKSYALVWVAVGNGTGSFVDPVACGQARIAQLRADKPDPSSRLRQKAEAVLRAYRDVLPGLQTLWIMFHRHGASSTGGTGIPLDGRVLEPGIVLFGSGEYVGFAAPGAVRVTADGRALHRVTAVRSRLFALRLPRGTGPVTLRQRAADGRVIRTETVRG
ncbi:hypothetical protein DSM104299_01699 [Baekduia alba]|uniref:hypothetical protein n=1 Tax=Baekduia alba TaxID=2997333 RepID=UPI0023425D97|nr:hypothetical protein [Baekduia alba]WCB92998.1 hypothetical protein DSM104299_01699 [Baekduia alba]